MDSQMISNQYVDSVKEDALEIDARRRKVEAENVTKAKVIGDCQLVIAEMAAELKESREEIRLLKVELQQQKNLIRSLEASDETHKAFVKLSKDLKQLDKLEGFTEKLERAAQAAEVLGAPKKDKKAKAKTDE